MSPKKKVLITFLGNINYDTRCKNLYDTLSANNFDVEFVGFDWLTKDFIETRGDVSIIKLKKGFLSLSFYLKFIWQIKVKLITTKASIIFVEDPIYTPIDITVPWPIITPSTISDLAPTKQLSPIITGLACNGSKTPPIPTPPDI